MPIIGLTDRQRSRYPEVGTIRKGEKKPKGGNHPGKDLTYFRLDTKDAGLQELWDRLYPGEPREIMVTLPYIKVEENFSAWMEEYVAGGMVHRCDGVRMVQQRNGDGEMVMFYGDDRPPCPGGCSIVGRLSVILPEMRRMSTVMILTGSINDVLNLTDNLNAFYNIKQNLMGIPFFLRRVEKTISTPGKNGKRARRKSWLLQLEPTPRYVAAQLEYREQEALPQIRVHLPAIAAPKARIKTDPDRYAPWDDQVAAANDEDPPEAIIEGKHVAETTAGAKSVPAPPAPSSSEPPFVPDDDSPAYKLRQELAYNAERYTTSYARGRRADYATAPASPGQAGLIASLLTEAFAPDENATKEYHSALVFLFGVDSATKLTFCEARATIDWLTYGKDKDTGEFILREGVETKARLCLHQAMLDAGQSELIGLDEEE